MLKGNKSRHAIRTENASLTKQLMFMIRYCGFGHHVSLEIAFVVEKCDNSLKLLDTFRSAEATSAHLKAIGGNHHMQHSIRKCQFLKQAWNVECAIHAAKVRSPVKIALT